ncbi:hypothetical protein ABBQ38_004579 [Trebouxia sp. C0009 RCD-2024]
MRSLALHRQEVCSLDKRHFNRSRRRLTHRACKPITRKAPCLGFPDGPGFKQDLETMLDMANSLRHDPEKPVFHVMPRHGWINDPNGPVYYEGKYHVFYQHIINGCEWDFGIVWGHAASSDLVHWEHMPPALLPTPGGADADGCFSGCCIVDEDGTPIILYTGVRLRSNPECGPLPPAECDLNLPFVETQLAAVPEGDPTLAMWSKREEPVLPMPPPDMPLVGWRDPYIFEIKGKQGNGREWGMLMGSGLKGQGGAIMIYRSESLYGGWRYDGMLCQADNVETGAMWECPLLLELTQTETKPKLSEQSTGGIQSINDSHTHLATPSGKAPTFRETHTQGGQTDKAVESQPGNFQESFGRSEPQPVASTSGKAAATAGGGVSLLSRQLGDISLGSREDCANAGADPQQAAAQQQHTHLLCISPDAPINPVLYWLGAFDQQNTKFVLEGAKGPLKLDLGDILYAPNLMIDGQGRHILWGWLQERRKVGSYDYAGCLSVPRILSMRGDRLIQEPVPEVSNLRRGRCWKARHEAIEPEEIKPLVGLRGSSLDIELILDRGDASSAGLLFQGWDAAGEGSAAIVFDWERSVLEAIYEAPPRDMGATQDPDAEEDDGLRRVGGPVEMEAGDVRMRILLDHSCVEVYLGTGEVLSTRIYRGHPPEDADAGISFVSYGGTAHVKRCNAWTVKSIWKRDFQPHEQASVFETIYEPVTAVMPMGSPVVPVLTS